MYAPNLVTISSVCMFGYEDASPGQPRFVEYRTVKKCSTLSEANAWIQAREDHCSEFQFYDITDAPEWMIREMLSCQEESPECPTDVPF